MATTYRADAELDRQHLAASRSYLRGFYGWSGARLDGFLAAEQELERFDAPKKCVKGLACGNSCIAKGRTCRAKGDPQKASRLKELVALPAAGQSSAAAMAKGSGGEEAIAQQKKAKNAAPPKASSQKAKNAAPEKPNSQKAKDPAPGKLSEQKAKEARDNAQLSAKLTAKDKKAISDYTKAAVSGIRSFIETNGCLRTPLSCEDPRKTKQFVKELDTALSKLPKNEDGAEFYRGVSASHGGAQALYEKLAKAKPGERLRDMGYGSYSADETVAKRFGLFGSASELSKTRSIIFKTRSKSLTSVNMLSENPREQEAILPRGAEQTIRRIVKEGKTLIVELD
jgi:hypothetical protein